MSLSEETTESHGIWASDPKDYRWSGYGEAVGGGRLARKGLGIAIAARFRRDFPANQTMAQYRALLYDSAQERKGCRPGEAHRRGIALEIFGSSHVTGAMTQVV